MLSTVWLDLDCRVLKIQDWIPKCLQQCAHLCEFAIFMVKLFGKATVRCVVHERRKKFELSFKTDICSSCLCVC